MVHFLNNEDESWCSSWSVNVPQLPNTSPCLDVFTGQNKKDEVVSSCKPPLIGLKLVMSHKHENNVTSAGC